MWPFGVVEVDPLAASALGFPRSRPGACNRARSARSTANGIDDSISVPGQGASPSPGARPGSSTGPSGQKIQLHRQFADLGVKLTNLAFMIPPPAFHTVREDLAKPFHRLALPCAHLVRMNLVLRGNLLQRPIAPKRFQRDLRFQLPRTPASLRHRVSPLSRWNTP